MAQPSTPASRLLNATSSSSSAVSASPPLQSAPPGAYSSIFGGGPVSVPPVALPAGLPAAPPQASPNNLNGITLATPGASGPGAVTPVSVASSSNNTYIMPNSPMKNRTNGSDGYRPKITRTLGQRPACLVNASVTYCGNNQIFAFGGFDQYTDEVYNHVLRLDLVSQQWSLVDNYGDIPGVRMGHTATLYQGNKLLVFGGENEHRTYLSDLIVFDLKTAHWTQPAVTGPIPKGRARHAAVLHEDKLFIIGGITGHDNYVLDDICYLDLKTFCWSRAWRFVGRFDHSAYIWGDRVWVFGGLSEDMDKVSDLWWLDLKGTPAFQSPPMIGSSLYDRAGLGSIGGASSSSRNDAGSPRPGYTVAQSSASGASGYAANSRTAQVNTPSFQLKSYAPMAPGSISALKFFSGPNTPNQGTGIHFHVYSAGVLLDFVTPAPTITSRECSLSTLDLATLRWQKLAEGREIFKPGYRWHYCTMNEDGTKAWLLGCPTDPSTIELGANGLEEYLSDIMEIDLRRYGLLGTNAVPDTHVDGVGMGPGMGGMMLSRPTSRVRHANDPPSMGLGSDLSRLFDQPPETGSGADFIVTAHSINAEDDETDHETDRVARDGGSKGGSREDSTHWLSPDAPTSQPIHVHRLILQARWPHFARLWSSQMAEFHTKKMHIPEPYTVVRAFLFYLYTDRIDPALPADEMDGSRRGFRLGSGVGTKRGWSPGDTSATTGSGSRQQQQEYRDKPPSCSSGGASNSVNVTADLSDVAGLLVMSNIYNIPHLRLLCVNRLSKELDVEHACIIWHCASLANEPWLRKRAAAFCLTHWGRIVRSAGFLRLPRTAIVELSQEIDTEGRVIGGDEVDLFGSALEGAGGVAGARISPNGSVLSRRKESISSSHASQMAESDMEDEDDDEGMDMN
ncbi:MAG: hypothetical protein SEPTF4163_002981 [Sporothrix epigloea]